MGFLPTFLSREADDTHRIVLYPPLPVADAHGNPVPPRQVLEDFAHIAMDYIGRRPCHYGWLLQAAWHRAPTDAVPRFEGRGARS